MNNAPTHPSHDLQSDGERSTRHFLPAIPTPLIQPMDKNVIESMKQHYQKGFMQKLVRGGD